MLIEIFISSPQLHMQQPSIKQGKKDIFLVLYKKYPSSEIRMYESLASKFISHRRFRFYTISLLVCSQSRIPTQNERILIPKYPINNSIKHKKTRGCRSLVKRAGLRTLWCRPARVRTSSPATHFFRAFCLVFLFFFVWSI
jgi:hypothetical protein